MPRSIEVQVRELHRGQARIKKRWVDSGARYLVVRAGRRWGKTIFEEEEAMAEAIAGRPVGWFAADDARMEEVWASISGRLRPIARKINASEGRIELVTGGLIEFWSLHGDMGIHAGRSRKYSLAIVDEAGIVPKLALIWRSAIRPTLVDLKGRAIFGSTSNRVGPFFNKIWLLGNGRDPKWLSFQCKTEDNPHIDPEEVAEARRNMPTWQAAEEYDGVPCDTGWQFFKESTLNAHIEAHARDPDAQGHIEIEASLPRDIDLVLLRKQLGKIGWKDDQSGPWKLWTQIMPRTNRPPQGFPYGVGCDISAGVGASNTVFSFTNMRTRVKVAEYAWPFTKPEEAARVCAAAGLWFGGTLGCARINPEVNGGGGEQFVNELVRLGYPQIAREKKPDVAGSPDSHRLGWWSTPKSKEALLIDYRMALAQGRYVNPSEMALMEAIGYIYDEKARVVPVSDDEGPQSEAAWAAHGDRVIADALSSKVCDTVGDDAPEEPEPPVHSIGHRIKEREKRKKEVANRGDSWEN